MDFNDDNELVLDVGGEDVNVVDLFALVIPAILHNDPTPRCTSILSGNQRFHEMIEHDNVAAFRSQARMNKPTFISLIKHMKDKAGMVDSRWISVGEKLAIFIEMGLCGAYSAATALKWQHECSRNAILTWQIQAR
jgi:hypothetical protein